MSDVWKGWDRKPKVYEDQAIPPRKEPLPIREQVSSAISALFRTPDLQFWDPFRSRAERFRQDAERFVNRESKAFYIGDFRTYYTTYRDLPKDVLEGYFGWRTRLRNGVFTPAPLSFKFLYVYEILSQIGVSSPESGYEILQALCANYPDPVLQEYLRRWGQDYLIYYQIGGEALEAAFADVREEDRVREILRWPQRFDPIEVGLAMQRISSYSEARSAFLRSHPENGREVMGKVYQALCEARRSAGNPRFPEMFSGTRGSWRYEMFRNAVFWDAEQHPDCRVEIDPVRSYLCKDGKWKCSGIGINHKLVHNPAMTALVRETDRCLREVFSFGHPLKPTQMGADTAEIVRKTVEAYDLARREALRPKVTVHRELLAGIRSDADDTMSRLLEGEEDVDAPKPRLDAAAAETAERESAPAPEEQNAPPAGLSAEEYRFLSLLLEGGDWKSFCAQRRLLPSLLADAINEKLMETVGDTVLESDGASWTVIPDYKDDLSSLLRSEESTENLWN